MHTTAWYTPKTGRSASPTGTPNSSHPHGSTRTENPSATPCTTPTPPNTRREPQPVGPNCPARVVPPGRLPARSMTWRLAGEVEPLAHRDPAALTAAALGVADDRLGGWCPIVFEVLID